MFLDGHMSMAVDFTLFVGFWGISGVWTQLKALRNFWRADFEQKYADT
jgi:hypothetical protein